MPVIYEIIFKNIFYNSPIKKLKTAYSQIQHILQLYSATVRLKYNYYGTGGEIIFYTIVQLKMGGIEFQGTIFYSSLIPSSPGLRTWISAIEILPCQYGVQRYILKGFD